MAGVFVMSWIVAASLQHTVGLEEQYVLLGIIYASSESKMGDLLTYVVSGPLRTDQTSGDVAIFQPHTTTASSFSGDL